MNKLREALQALVQLEADGHHASENAIEYWERARAALAEPAPAEKLRAALDALTAVDLAMQRNAERRGQSTGYADGWHDCLRRVKSELHAALAEPVADEPVADMPDRWVIVRQTALDVGRGDDVRTGGKPELGYALIRDAETFPNEDTARAALESAALPLGWVLMRLSALLPDLYTRPAAAPAERGELVREFRATGLTPSEAVTAAKALTDEQATKLCAVGPVHAPDGSVNRTPAAYRRELQDATLRGFRLAERAHGIGAKP